MTTPARALVRGARLLLPGAALLAGAVAAVRSVPYFRTWIVTTYTVLFVLLAVAVVLRWRLGVPGRFAGALLVAAAGALQWFVPPFTYLPPPAAGLVRGYVAAGTVVTALVLALAPRGTRGAHRTAALVLAAGVFVAGAAAVIVLDPAPHIDVWYTLQGGADAVLHGRNPYTQVWPGPPDPPPSRMDAFTYLPWTAVLLAPAKLLTGDVRWGLAAGQIVAAGAVAALAGRPGSATSQLAGGRDVERESEQRADAATTAALLLLLLPGTLTSVEQAWTEPLIFLLVALALLALDRGRPVPAVVALALALASKQHLALLLPLLAVWRPVGPRRTLAVAAGAGVLVLPWVVADPAAIWHDTVTLLVGFHPILFADTLYLAALNGLGWRPPFWLTGVLVVALVAAVTVLVRRRRPAPAAFGAFAGLTLLGANLVNKQAFYNQYWLAGALVLASWPALAVRTTINGRPVGPADEPGESGEPAPTAGHGTATAPGTGPASGATRAGSR